MADVEQVPDPPTPNALTILEHLCRQPSIAAQKLGMDDAAELVQEMLDSTGFNTKRIKVKGAPDYIYGELSGRSDFTLLLYNHYDVQPAEPIELWDTPPFEPTTRDGKFYARGSSDNKGEIAARLAAVQALLAGEQELPISIRWIIEGEEEIGSPHFPFVAQNYAGLLEADACLWEGSGFDIEDRPMLMLGTKGLLYVQYETEGAGIDAHSGNAPILPNPAWRLVKALASLKDSSGRVLIPGFYDDVVSPTEAQLNATRNQANMDDAWKTAFKIQHFNDDLQGISLRERLAYTPTANIAGFISGYTGDGVKTVLPSRAMAKMDFRLVPDQDPEDILEKLSAHLHSQGYNDVSVKKLGAAEPFATPIDHPLVQRIRRIAEHFAGKPASIDPMIGGTLPLLGALRKYVGVPGLSSPGNPVYWGSGAHAPNEHIRLSDLDRAVKFNVHLFKSLAGN